MKDGNIALNVSGGTPPYIFAWSNDEKVSSINNLPAGFYSVHITDSLTNDTTLQITLTEPEPLAMKELDAYRYANGFNVSSFGACNGSVTTTVSGGVLPYTYFWKPGQQTLLTPVNLCGGENVLTVTDLNGCEVRNSVYLKEPQRDDWTMTGNAGSNPNFNFIGTSDSIDFVFKTNNTERMKIGSDGKVNIPSFADTSYHLLMSDNNGNLVKAIPIPTPAPSPFWFTTGNNNIQNNSFIGPTNNKDFIIKTGDAAWGTLQERVRVTITGKVGIDTPTPSQKLEVTHSDQYGGIAINQISNQYYTSEIKFNYQGIQKWATGCYLGSNNNQSYFIWNHGLTTPRTAFFIDGTNNNTGIDTDAPTAKLDVNGNIRVRSLSGNNGKLVELDANGNFQVSAASAGAANLWQSNGTTAYYNSGNVFIGMNNCTGCTNAFYKLYVEGGIAAREVKVTAATTFPDYVFEKDYNLMSIYELEAYLTKHKHLPEIPGAGDVAANGGFEVGDMQTKLLKKIEEQTLYIISLQKQLDELKTLVKSNK